MKYLLSFFLLIAISPTFATIKAVAFDFDGVVGKIDREEVVAFIQNSFQLTQEEARELGKGWKMQVRCGDVPAATYWENALAKKGKVLPEKWVENFNDAFAASITVNPLMIQKIQELQKQGYKTPLLSNVDEGAAAVIRKKGYYAFFNPVLLSYAIGVDKPDKRAYAILLEKMALLPSEIIFVDDTKENVDAASAVGIVAIQFISYEQFEMALNKAL